MCSMKIALATTLALATCASATTGGLSLQHSGVSSAHNFAQAASGARQHASSLGAEEKDIEKVPGFNHVVSGLVKRIASFVLKPLSEVEASLRHATRRSVIVPASAINGPDDFKRTCLQTLTQQARLLHEIQELNADAAPGIDWIRCHEEGFSAPDSSLPAELATLREMLHELQQHQLTLNEGVKVLKNRHSL
jgi:hypothetical protein